MTAGGGAFHRTKSSNTKCLKANSAAHSSTAEPFDSKLSKNLTCIPGYCPRGNPLLGSHERTCFLSSQQCFGLFDRSADRSMPFLLLLCRLLFFCFFMEPNRHLDRDTDDFCGPCRGGEPQTVLVCQSWYKNLLVSHVCTKRSTCCCITFLIDPSV